MSPALFSFERLVRRRLVQCDVEVGGSRPWDLRVHDASFYRRLALNPAFELGETYMDGLWDCDSIDGLSERLTRGGLAKQYQHNAWFRLKSAVARLWNRQSRGRAKQVAEHHYDLGVDVFRAMLDPSMTYTCAYWDQASEHDRSGGASLEQAQAAKLRLICDKLELKPGESFLDIGCGFGGLSEFAAKNYDVKVLAITNSQDHARVTRERCASLSAVEVALMDYRELGTLGRRFDKIASIEMIEAVGPQNYAEFMAIVGACLEPGGSFLLQCLISKEAVVRCNDWFDRYIFPNGVSPSMQGIEAAATPCFGRATALQAIGRDYDPTLMAWDANFTANWRTVAPRCTDRFRRMWHFYLTFMAGFFRADGLDVYQLVFRNPVSRSVSRTGAAQAATPETLRA